MMCLLFTSTPFTQSRHLLYRSSKVNKTIFVFETFSQEFTNHSITWEHSITVSLSVSWKPPRWPHGRVLALSVAGPGFNPWKYDPLILTNTFIERTSILKHIAIQMRKTIRSKLWKKWNLNVHINISCQSCNNYKGKQKENYLFSVSCYLLS